MSVYVVSGGGFFRCRFVDGLPRCHVPDVLYGDGGRPLLLLTPGRASQMMSVFMESEDRLFSRVSAYELARSDYDAKFARVAASTAPEERLAPLRSWLSSEKGRLDILDAKLRSEVESMKLLVGKFLAALDVAIETFWTDEEYSSYHRGQQSPASSDDGPRYLPPPSDWLTPDRCDCCDGQKKVFGCQTEIRLAAERHAALYANCRDFAKQFSFFVESLSEGPERLHWEAVRDLLRNIPGKGF